VAIDAFDRVAVLVEREALGAERHTLVDSDTISENCGFTDHDTGSVIDEDPFTDCGAGMDVDAGAAVCVLGDDTRNQRHPKAVQYVSDAVAGECEYTWVAKDRFRGTRCSWITLIRGHGVERELTANLRQAAEKIGRESLRLAKADLRTSVDLVSLARKP
jgi:hypothetical protein